jgi:signal transduction histidine kinase
MRSSQLPKNKVLFQKIWNEKNIASRSLLMSFLVPLILVAASMLIKFKFNPHTVTPPYVLFFAIILISACYGGARAALCASFISFVAAISLLPYQPIVTHLLEALAFCMEALFLSYLIFCFQTQRKRNKEAALSMKTVNDLLHKREKDHENFVHMAAHELKSPVTVLKGYKQVIEARLIANQQKEEIQLLAKMDLQLVKLSMRINDLLDLAKVNAGPMQYNMLNFDINDCLLSCVEETKISNPDIVIEYNLINQTVMVNGDVERIQQVVANLLNNAVKYSKNDRYIKVTSELIDKKVSVKVLDHGIGIPDDKKQFVFEKFYRVDKPSVIEKSGLGLGLFICNEIIKNHNGEMGLFSEEGRGSTFWFSLPVV